MDFEILLKDHAHTTSCSICGEIKMTIRSGDALGQFLKKKKKKSHPYIERLPTL